MALSSGKIVRSFLSLASGEARGGGGWGNLVLMGKKSTCLKTPTPTPTLRHFSTSQALLGGRASVDGDFVTLHWDTPTPPTPTPPTFPASWLRDNCQCPSCFHPVSKARLLLMKDLDVDIRPKTVQVDQETDEVSITWPDGHVSRFAKDWLLARAFTPENCSHREENERELIGEKRLWGAEYAGEMARHDFNRIMSDDRALYDWLKDLQTYGLTIIESVPCQKDTLMSLVDHFAILRTTQYGRDFEVKVKADPNNLAYTNTTLGIHLDLTSAEDVPGIQFLHCIQQADIEGGENQLVDGFKVAEILRSRYPEAWSILTQVNVDFVDVGRDKFGQFHTLSSKPVIGLDSQGNPTQICYNNQLRDSFMRLSHHSKVKPVLKALKLMNTLGYDPANCVRHKLNPGECLAFDNHRVLHGRQGYTVSPGGQRHLQGCYINWDEVKSKLRVLAEKLGRENIQKQAHV